MPTTKIIADSRDQIPDFLNHLGLTGLGVEVGVQKGIFSQLLLSKTQLAKLYLVDMWRKIPTGYDDIANVGPYGHLQAMMQAFLHVYNFEDRAVLIREKSDAAAKLFADGTLDFVYLDGDHSGPGILADLKSWYPKVKKGGVISGHDYLDATVEESGGVGEFAVKAMVNDFADALKKSVMLTGEDPVTGYPSWLVQV